MAGFGINFQWNMKTNTVRQLAGRETQPKPCTYLSREVWCCVQSCSHEVVVIEQKGFQLRTDLNAPKNHRIEQFPDLGSRESQCFRLSSDVSVTLPFQRIQRVQLELHSRDGAWLLDPGFDKDWLACRRVCMLDEKSTPIDGGVGHGGGHVGQALSTFLDRLFM